MITLRRVGHSQCGLWAGNAVDGWAAEEFKTAHAPKAKAAARRQMRG
jgi:hypothetical protein